MSVRLASEALFPYGWPGQVSYFLAEMGTVEPLTTRDDLRYAVADALVGDADIYAAWPGQYRTDLFLIDKPQLLADAIGVKAA